MGSMILEAQPPNVIAADQTVRPTDGDIKPDPGTRDCTSLEGLSQVCEADGTVTLSFYISNNSPYYVNYIRITGPNGWFQNIPTNLPSNTVSNVQVTYPGAVQGSTVCFDVKLYNPFIGICCHERICIRVDECPCGTIGREDIDCLPTPGTYEYCFEINNPAYSNNTIDQLTLFTTTNDVCLDGTPLPTTISIPAIAPGNTGTVCVVFSGCTSPLSDGDVIDFIIFLEDTGDLDYCCHLPSRDLTMPNCCDLSSSETTTNATCTLDGAGNPVFASDGTATVTVTNGTAPYTGTYSGQSNGNINSNSGTINITGLAAGTYNYSITDANGCPITGTFTVAQGACPCNINASPSGGNGGWNGTFTSFGAGFLCINFNTLTVPDQVIITINHPNGTQTIVDSGPWSSNLTTAQANANYPGCGGNVTGGGGNNFTPSIPIGPGDVITIQVLGSVCGTPNTAWALTATCQATPCVTPIPFPGPMPSEAPQQVGDNKNRIGQTTTNSALQVFPNPVQDVLTIKNTDSEVEYEVVTILDASGKIVKTTNISSNTETRVDVSSLPRGIYFIDAMDSTGNKVTERFVKVN